MALVIDAALDIEASAETVWEVITDFARYGEWNPFISACSTTLKPGDPIDLQVHLSPSTTRPQREWMLTHTPGREFSYRMKPAPLGALRSRRSHQISVLAPGRCRYDSHFELAGWLQPMVGALLGANLQRGFAGMNRGVKNRAEQLWRERQLKQ
jgi:hypothetical protein